ncbi:MAG: peptidoglycan/LPS O-acetylase OafA/YrhL [Saprospiraceae bacterium]|jgi:peptidoglycan/LPS O-acetylase OafA/YrhL
MSQKLSLKHNNNFNFIRTIAALQVLVVHSFHHFELDSAFVDYIKVFPGVPIFFFLSGYLISKSYESKEHLGIVTFFKNRILRIFPALIVCVVVSIAAVFFTGYFSEVSFTAAKFLSWFVAQISFFQFYNVDFMRGYGVGVLNGSLWTIAVELQFYALTPILFYLFRKSKVFVAILLLGSLAINFYIKPGWGYNWSSMPFKLLYASSLPWFYMFVLGFLYSQYAFLREFASKVNVFLLLGLYILSMNFVGSYEVNGSNAINPVSVLILTVFLTKLSKVNLKLPTRIQSFLDNYDISYGMYIYHMPVINVFLYTSLFTGLSNIFLVIIITFVFAFLSWTLVEKKSLKLKT